MAQRTEASRFNRDEVGELIRTATRLDDLVEDDQERGLTYEELVDVAGELGISADAVAAAVSQRENRRRADAKTVRKRVRRRMRFIRHATIYTVVVLALLLIDALGGGGWWFFYVAAIWGIVLALHGLRFVTGRRGPVERYLLDRERRLS